MLRCAMCERPTKSLELSFKTIMSSQTGFKSCVFVLVLTGSVTRNSGSEVTSTYGSDPAKDTIKKMNK